MGFWDDPYADYERSSSAKSQGHFQRHPFEDAKSAIRFLKQDEWWADGGYNRVAIKEMEPGYLLATMTHLLRRAPALKLSIELYYAKNGADPALIEKLEKMGSEKFIKETVLFKAMKQAYLSEPEVPDIFDE